MKISEPAAASYRCYQGLEVSYTQCTCVRGVGYACVDVRVFCVLIWFAFGVGLILHRLAREPARHRESHTSELFARITESIHHVGLIRGLGLIIELVRRRAANELLVAFTGEYWEPVENTCLTISIYTMTQ